MSVLKDKNFKKYAIRSPKNINQITTISNWAKKTTLKKILNHEKIVNNIYNFRFPFFIS